MRGRAVFVTLLFLVILAAPAPPSAWGAEGEAAPAAPAAAPAAPEGAAPPPAGAPAPAAKEEPEAPDAVQYLPSSQAPGAEAPTGDLPPGEAPGGEAPAVAPLPPEGILHTVVERDTLWDLSEKYLGSPWLWPEIWERNRFITNPHYIYPGIQVLIAPPAPREYAFEVREGAPAPEGIPAPPSAVEEAKAPPEPEAVPAAEARRVLGIGHNDFVRAGEFLLSRPRGIGRIRSGPEPKVAFAEGDTLYLALDVTVSPGQLLGVYRVRGPVSGPAGRRLSGYVKFLVGVLQVTEIENGVPVAVVRKSFEDLLRRDLITDEVPGYSAVYIEPGGEGLAATVISGRSENKELADGDFVFLDRGGKAGIAAGNVFRIYRGGSGPMMHMREQGSPVRVEVARAVVVKVLPETATAYVVKCTQSFEAGISAVRGEGARP